MKLIVPTIFLFSGFLEKKSVTTNGPKLEEVYFF